MGGGDQPGNGGAAAGGSTAAGGSATAGGSAAAGGSTAAGGFAARGSFKPPTLISSVSSPTATDDDPSFSGDRLELYFNSDREGGPGKGDIWMSRRASSTDPWGAPSLVSALSSTASETTPKISSDGLTLWFASDRDGCVGKIDIWVSTRVARNADWQTPSCVTELSSSADDVAASTSASMSTVILTSMRAGSTGEDLYWATRASATAWSRPELLPGDANTNANDGDGCLVPDGRRLYFSSTGHKSATPNDAGVNLFVAELGSNGAFGSVSALTELNSRDDDADPWVSEDEQYIVFSSTRSGNGDIYEAWR